MKQTALILVFSLSILMVQAQKLGEILKEIKNGERVDKIIPFGNEDELEYMPLTVIKGNKAGPVFTIVAGIHGYEYPPIIAAQELMKEINPSRFQGTLIILPIANIASFYKRSPFINPIDQINLNNAFPGSPNGSVSEKIAHWITEEIIPYSNVFLDIHGGDANEDLLPFICYYDNKDDQTEEARQLSEASGMRFIVSYPYNITKTEPAKYAFKQAVQSGITALSIEAGKLGTVQSANVQLIKNAVYNMLGYSKMYKAEKVPTSANKKYLHNQSYIRVPKKGLFYSTVKSGDKVTKDQNLGYVTDEFGNIIDQVMAPVTGIVLYKVGTPPVNTGETLFCIAY